jgi:type II secretory pathway predicted ATPase ExeA
MYYDYFGLKQPPFRITPDTSLFYPGGDRGAVLDALIYAILNGEGMVKVVGEVGSGKTMLCRMLEKELPDKVEVVYLANPSLSPENILQAIAFELKLSVQPDTSRLQVMHDLQEYLLKRHAENRQVIVFVEEAQAMPIATLEEIRLLSNLETQQSKLLQIALFGQPELDELISKPEIRQLKERITYSFQLNPFVKEHIRDYVSTRLRASGHRAGEVFNKGAIRKIEYYSKGLLRRVNILADKSLLAAYADNTHEVTAAHVKQAARDSEFITSKKTNIWVILLSASILLLILGYAAYIQMYSTENSKKSGLSSVESTNFLLEGSAETLNSEFEPQTQSEELDLKVKEMDLDLGPGIEEVIESREIVSKFKDSESELLAEDTLDLSGDVMPAEASSEETIIIGMKGTEKRALKEPDSVNSHDKRRNSSSQLEIAGQLLDLSILFQIQDLGDIRLSEQESAVLRKQLENLPPEVALYSDSSQFSDICRLCSSILYRPLTKPENL